jgi:hypothetical protein
MLSANCRSGVTRCLGSRSSSILVISRSNLTARVAIPSINSTTTTYKMSNRTTALQSSIRLLSSNSSPMGPLRSQPQYAIFGEKTMLSIKMIPPTFRCLKNGSIVLDQNKKGRILLEWSPRGDGGKFVCTFLFIPFTHIERNGSHHVSSLLFLL